MIGSEVSHDFELGEKEQDPLFLLISASGRLFLLGSRMPSVGRNTHSRMPSVVRSNTQPEAQNVVQNVEEQPNTGGPAPEEDVSFSLAANVSLLIAKVS